MKLWQAIGLIVASLLSVGCSELETVPTQVPHEASTPRMEVPEGAPERAISTGSQTPPGDVPEEFIGHSTWIDVSADVGWMSSNQAYGQAIVRYWASNVIAAVELKVRNAQGVQVGENSAHEQDWWLIPWRGTLYASTTVTVSGTCGHIAQVKASGTVWDAAISSAQGLLSWGNQGRTASKSAEQPACAPTTCLDASATNYGGTLPCTYSTSGTASGGDGSSTPSTGGTTTEPPSYQPGPFVPSGHWECVIYYQGTDYEREYCTWYADNATRLATSSPAFARLGATSSPSSSRLAADLPSVFVIVTDQLPAGASAVIDRHRDGPYRNVLLVPTSAIRPAVFVAALRALAESRGRHGERPGKELQLVLKGTVLDQQIPAAARDHATRFTALIAGAKRSDAGAYGTRQILEIRLADR